MPTKVYVLDIKGRDFYYLQWDDPTTGKRITRSSKCKDRRSAERAAIDKERELATGQGIATRRTFAQFVSLYQMEHLMSLALRSRLKAVSVLECYNRLMNPKSIENVTAAAIATYASKLRTDELDESGRVTHRHRSEATIATHLRTLRAALAWAKQKGMIGYVPDMPKIRRKAGSRVTKGRPVSPQEFHRMLRSIRVVVKDWRPWFRLLCGLWLSGLRIGEAMQLRWKAGRFPSVDLNSEPGWLLIPADFDKGHRDRRIPLTPDFADWLRRHQNKGEFVLSPGCDDNKATKVISAIGAAANVVTDPASGRTATAHDLRRAFAQRWSSEVSTIDLQRMMRHGSIETTKSYYLDDDAEALATRLLNISLNKNKKTH